ncbi:hypothetical protein PIL02S_00846 [Paenibacillus illinoisensis]|uniref:Uncharacterized protein n=1 Tax=Paenibacillus illinoisensis TaxID=59845 RepID=A0A2W0CEU3_9BACL|nr:hypothetical protein PIL02S_00846 [Paenibacillus illinoisensis]
MLIKAGAVPSVTRHRLHPPNLFTPDLSLIFSIIENLLFSENTLKKNIYSTLSVVIYS